MNKILKKPVIDSSILSPWEAKLLEAKGVRIKMEEEDVLSVKDDVPVRNAIFFDTPETMEQATGMLMFRGIPWKRKDSGAKNYLEFDSRESLLKALPAIKRKFDIVENGNRVVARIEFDNLNDFKRVMNFIERTNMGISFDDAPSSDLTEDAPELDVRPSKKNPNVVVNAGNFRAKPKNKTEEKIAVEDPTQRRVRIQRRW